MKDSLDNTNQAIQKLSQLPVDYIFNNYLGPAISFSLFTTIIFHPNNSIYDVK